MYVLIVHKGIVRVLKYMYNHIHIKILNSIMKNMYIYILLNTKYIRYVIYIFTTFKDNWLSKNTTRSLTPTPFHSSLSNASIFSGSARANHARAPPSDFKASCFFWGEKKN